MSITIDKLLGYSILSFMFIACILVTCFPLYFCIIIATNLGPPFIQYCHRLYFIYKFRSSPLAVFIIVVQVKVFMLVMYDKLNAHSKHIGFCYKCMIGWMCIPFNTHFFVIICSSIFLRFVDFSLWLIVYLFVSSWLFQTNLFIHFSLFDSYLFISIINMCMWRVSNMNQYCIVLNFGGYWVEMKNQGKKKSRKQKTLKLDKDLFNLFVL